MLKKEIFEQVKVCVYACMHTHCHTHRDGNLSAEGIFKADNKKDFLIT